MDYIKEYLSRNWIILPVKHGEKKPNLSSWKEISKTDINTLNPEEGLGLKTGNGVAVIDVEKDCSIPVETILESFPTNCYAKTGSGGYHFYYKTNQVVKSSVRIFDKVDIRGEPNGFVVLPPTVHKSGNRYEWVEFGELGEFPYHILSEAIQKPNEKSWVTEILSGVDKGKRNDSLAKLIGYLKNKNLPRDIIQQLIFNWNTKNKEPLPRTEVLATLNSIMSLPTKEKEDSNSLFMSFDDYSSKFGEVEEKWLVKNWIPDKSVTFVVAPPESFKTWLIFELAIAVANGYDFLGEEVKETGPVLIIQQEDSHQAISERLNLITVCKEYPNLYSKDFFSVKKPKLDIYIHPDRILKFKDKRILEQFEEQIKIIKPKLIIIDPLYSAVSSENYMASAAEEMMILKKWRDNYGLSVVISHHSKKALEQKSTAREDIWGSQFLNAFLENGWQIRKVLGEENKVIIRRHSKSTGNLEPITITFDISTTFPFKYQTTIGKDTNENPILSALQYGPLQQQEITDATGCSKATVSRKIKTLVQQGLINFDGEKFHLQRRNDE